ncbi:MAG TPA: hypothetical protein VL400_22935 [Polyangiaceae bacterium]|jgi:hypothetical protein|nr:hypothetical protein [Polyangiaceae bacterium]
MMRRGTLFGSLALLCATSATGSARADEPDGVYGRLDGDLLFAGAVGTALEAGGPQLETDVSLTYLSTAGPYVRYADALGQDDARFRRSFALGLELRPLFLGRYALDLEKGPAYLDLFLDSLTLRVGAVWADDRARGFAARPGLELAVGLELPFLPSGSGPYLGVEGVARFHEADFAGTVDRDLLDQGALFVVTLSWHQVIDAGLVDARDAGTEP